MVSIPVNPSFGSLNLAQAVVVVAYEWYQAYSQSHLLGPLPAVKSADLASKQDVTGLLQQLENELLTAGYFRAANKRVQMTRNLFNIFSRTDFTSLEIRTLRGVVSTLVNPNGIYTKKQND